MDEHESALERLDLVIATAEALAHRIPRLNDPHTAHALTHALHIRTRQAVEHTHRLIDNAMLAGAS